MGGELYGGQDPGALGPPSIKEQAVQAATEALCKADVTSLPTTSYALSDVARIAVEAAWEHINWATDAEIRDLQGRLAQCDRNWEQACGTTEDLEHRLHRTEARVAALEQAARDFLSAADGPSSWGEYELAKQRLRAVLDGTDCGEAGP
jgi:hypothetical protein